MMQAQPRYTNLTPLLTIARLGTSSQYELPLEHLDVRFDIPLVRYGGAYWYDTPEEGLEQYRRLADSSYLHTLRMQFAFHTLAGWNATDQQRTPGLWSSFVQELCGSTNPLKRVEGYYLSFADAKPPQQQEGARALFKVAIETAGPLVAAGLTEGLVKDIDHLIADPPRGFPGHQINMNIRDSFGAFQSDFQAVCQTAWGVRRFEAIKEYLSNPLSAGKPLAPFECRTLLYGNVADFNRLKLVDASAARALLPPLRDYKLQLEQAQTTNPNAP
jgi:hypothetical protein